MTETEDDQSNPSFKKTKVQTNEKFRHKLDIHLNWVTIAVIELILLAIWQLNLRRKLTIEVSVEMSVKNRCKNPKWEK